MKTERYLTADQAATHLRVEAHTMYRLARPQRFAWAASGGSMAAPWYRAQLTAEGGRADVLQGTLVAGGAGTSASTREVSEPTCEAD